MVCKVLPRAAAALPVLVAGILAFSLNAAAAQERPVRAAPGARTVISLPENPTTGYVWRFDPQRSRNAVIVNVHDLGFSRPDTGRPLVGAPGLHRWSIEGLRVGHARLLFSNSRPWEGQPVRQRTIAVDVR